MTIELIEPQEERTVTIKGFVYEQKYTWDEKPSYVFYSSEECSSVGEHCSMALIGPVQFDYTIPAGFNPTAIQLAALAKERASVVAQFTARIAELDEQAKKLQCLEMAVEA